MKRLLLAGLLGMALVAPARADFWRGVTAYNQGDYAAAFELWKPLAEQGHGGAQNNLAIMYDEGEEVPRDRAEAVRWYAKAAEQGLADAQYNLGLMYEKGLGVPRDRVQAHMWYGLAAHQGNEAGRRNLEAVAKEMSEGEIAKAIERALAWVLEHQRQ